MIYNIPCFDYSWSYVGETGRSFQTRKKEHIAERESSNIAKHEWNYDNKIDVENGKVIDSGNYRTRKTFI